MYFLVNTSPKRLDIATTNFAGAYSRSHDVEGTGQSFVSQGQRQKKQIFETGYHRLQSSFSSHSNTCMFSHPVTSLTRPMAM